MLKSLRIQNFKAWKDTGTIRMAPITLFFGANSSGKSSIGQFLMMLKQTAASSDRRTVFYPGGKDSAVQLGKWWGWKDALSEVGIDVRFLCPDYVKEKYANKMNR